MCPPAVVGPTVHRIRALKGMPQPPLFAALTEGRKE